MKKNTKPDLFKILKYALAGIAVLNLLLLFVWESDLLPFSGKGGTGSEQTVEYITTSSDSDVEPVFIDGFSFSSDELTYDGGDLDLLDGVTFGSLTRDELRRRVFARISAGSAIDRKVVTYSIDTEMGQITASRPLILDNYSGPVLSLPEPLPTVPLSDPSGIVGELLSDGQLTCDDGFGMDISSALTCTYTLDVTNAEHISYRFALTNMFNDSAYVYAEGEVAPDIPYIELVTDSVLLPTGADFGDPYSYIAQAVDTNGDSIERRVHVSGSVNTAVPGTYLLTYTADSAAGAPAPAVTLTVRVTDS